MNKALELGFKMETKGTKVKIFIINIIYLIFTVVAGALYLRNTSNVSDIQTWYEDTCIILCPDVVYYDVMYRGVGTQYTDPVQAAKYEAEAADYSAEEYNLGCRWSIVFKFAGITLILVAVNALL